MLAAALAVLLGPATAASASPAKRQHPSRPEPTYHPAKPTQIPCRVFCSLA
jgi:hypothetical protein